jgi:hypothetical protein
MDVHTHDRGKPARGTHPSRKARVVEKYGGPRLGSRSGLGNADGRVVAFGVDGLRHQGAPMDQGARHTFPWDDVRELQLFPGTAFSPFPWINDTSCPQLVR